MFWCGCGFAQFLVFSHLVLAFWCCFIDLLSCLVFFIFRSSLLIPSSAATFLDRIATIWKSRFPCLYCIYRPGFVTPCLLSASRTPPSSIPTFRVTRSDVGSIIHDGLRISLRLYVSTPNTYLTSRGFSLSSVSYSRTIIPSMMFRFGNQKIIYDISCMANFCFCIRVI